MTSCSPDIVTPSSPHPDPWQRLVKALPSVMQGRELEKQLTELSDLFSQSFPHYRLDWYWRGRCYGRPHEGLTEYYRHSCNNLLSGRVYGADVPDEQEQNEQVAWLQACADVLSSHGRVQLSRSDFTALVAIYEELQNAIYIQAANQYIELFTDAGQCYLHRVNLHQVESMFGDVLCRVHRSYLIKPDAVTGIERKRNGRYVLLLGEAAIPIGDSHLPKVREQYPEWFVQRSQPKPLQGILSTRPEKVL